jgi:hypothetical protein
MSTGEKNSIQQEHKFMQAKVSFNVLRVKWVTSQNVILD